MSAALAHLQELHPPAALFSHPEPFVLHVKGLTYKQPNVRIPTHRSFAERGGKSRPSIAFLPSDIPGLPSHNSDLERQEDRRDPREFDDGIQDPSDSSQVSLPPSAVHQQNAVAANEALLHAERHSALRFYNTIPRPHSLLDLPRPNSAKQLPPKKRSRASLSDFPPPKPALNPLMLFRRPPHRNSLPAAPGDGAPRKRSRLAQGPLRADEARKSVCGQEGVSSMIGMVLKRAQPPGASSRDVEARDYEDRPVSKNPFKRWAVGSAEAEGSAGPRKVGAPVEAAAATAASKPRPWATDAAPVSNLKPDKSMDASRPLRPITSLKVPPLPPSIVAAISTDKMQAEDQKGKKAGGGGAQMTLPVLVRRASMQSLKTESKDPAEGRGARKAGKSKDVKAARKSFDWKGWAGG